MYLVMVVQHGARRLREMVERGVATQRGGESGGGARVCAESGRRSSRARRAERRLETLREVADRLRQVRRDRAQHVRQQQVDRALVQGEVGGAQPRGEVASREQPTQRASAESTVTVTATATATVVVLAVRVVAAVAAPPERAPRPLDAGRVESGDRLEELDAALPATRSRDVGYYRPSSRFDASETSAQTDYTCDGS